MSLSAELIQRFARITNDTSQTKKESTVYGTIVTTDGADYVHIDGAYSKDGTPMLIPLITTVAVQTGNRVIVSIRNHTAVVTGNLTTPSTTVEHVTEVERSISREMKTNYAQIASLEAAEAAISDLVTNDLIVKSTLEAQQVLIEGKLDAKTAEITYAKIEQVDAHYGEFDTLRSDYASFKETYTEDLIATDADIAKLDAEVADINTLMFGSAAGSVLQTSFANAVIALLGDAWIKSAMVESLSADKINAGNINTNNVKVQSKDGSLVIFDNLIQIKDGQNVRVQIGKDASGNYSIAICDKNGATMFDVNGITENAIKEAIIVDAMVSEGANISGSKINIDSLIRAINENGSSTIKSTKVYFDDEEQTLDIMFKELSTDVGGIAETVVSQGVEITALKDSIETKVWQQDINNLQIGGRNLLKNSRHILLGSNNKNLYPIAMELITEDGREFYRYTRTMPESKPTTMSVYSNIPTSQLTERLTGKEVTFSFLIRCSHETETSIMGLLIDRTDNEEENFGNGIIETPVGTTWNRVSVTKVIDLDYAYNSNNILRFNPLTLNIPEGEIDNFYMDVCEWKIEFGNKATDWTPAPEDTEGEITTLSTKYTLLEQDVDSITTTVASHTAQLAENSEEITLAQSTIGQLADSISMLVTDGNGTSLMTQTEDGWTFSTSDIQAAVDRTSEALADLTAQCGNTDAAVEVLQQSVSDLGVMAEYIRIGTHEGEPCIELGEGDSNFKLLITNTRILFMDGSDIPAYINNKSLYIKKAVIEEELHQGGFSWVSRSNGHLSLIWKGVTE